MEDVSEETEEDADTYGFRFMRDYDAIRRDTNKEYIFVIEEGEEQEPSEVKNEENTQLQNKGKRAKGAYYVPLVSHTLLRKRRARKGEVTNDYDDLGVEFWGGMLVSLGGKEVFPEDEAEARKAELDSIRMPLSVANEPVAAAAENGGEQGGQVNGQ